MNHISVLLSEAVEELVWNVNGVYVDGTFGLGGHSRKLLDTLSTRGSLVAIDWDPYILFDSIKDSRFHGVTLNFKDIDQVLKKKGLESLDGALLDLGISTNQRQNKRRGFSLKEEGYLSGKRSRL
jgi:16S rRNA (cytosine1402-N4)-methyltransferase